MLIKVNKDGKLLYSKFARLEDYGFQVRNLEHLLDRVNMADAEVVGEWLFVHEGYLYGILPATKDVILGHSDMGKWYPAASGVMERGGWDRKPIAEAGIPIKSGYKKSLFIGEENLFVGEEQ